MHPNAKYDITNIKQEMHLVLQMLVVQVLLVHQSPWTYGTYHNQIPIWYFNTAGACGWTTVSGLPRFTNQFDSDMSGIRVKYAFSTDYVQNKISYGNQWTDAYKNNEGVIIHFHTWYTNVFHTILHDSVRYSSSFTKLMK